MWEGETKHQREEIRVMRGLMSCHRLKPGQNLHILWDYIWLLKGDSAASHVLPGDLNKRINLTTYKNHIFLKIKPKQLLGRSIEI